ncbi:MAG TPA: translation initiation factor IF-2, partial [Pirellulales bacterium]|nr:translation initiation factor IF-2 [Pirellulales bacterium]
MSVRIYALAKELGIDSKECVDLCAKAGVTGKGSALASLTDEEEVKVRAYIAGGVSKGVSRGAAVASAKGGVATLAPPEPPPISRETYIPPGGTLGKPPVLPSKPPAPSKPERVERPSAAEAPPKKAAPEGPKAPTIRVAPLPTAQQPLPPKKPSEPAPQKP